MRHLLQAAGILCLVATACLGISACQTYDFEPVTPRALAQSNTKQTVAATRRKPNLFFVVDTSGSMNDTDAGQGVTRMNAMKSAMNSFFTQFQNNPTARVGLIAYPKSACEPPTLADVKVQIPSGDADTDLQTAATQTNSIIQGLNPSGGTPTAKTLQLLLNYAPLLQTDRQNFVVLLTDGLPNCDAANPLNNCNGASACTGVCDTVSWSNLSPTNTCCTVSGSGACGGSACALNCLNGNATVTAVQQLRLAGIKTIVIGFGAALGTGAGPVVLNSMGAEGGFPRTCRTNTDCGQNDVCNLPTGQLEGTCQRKFFQAANSTTLLTELTRIIQGIPQPCEWALESAPTDPALLSVLVDGEAIYAGPTTYTYSSGRVTFVESGEICQRLKTATEDNPVSVEFRVLTTL